MLGDSFRAGTYRILEPHSSKWGRFDEANVEDKRQEELGERQRE